MGAHGYLISGTTAAWLRGQMERKAPGSAAEGQTRHGRPAFSVEDEFARPFEVRFAPSLGEEGESGKWIIWLPSDAMLIVNGEPVDLTAKLYEAGDPYPSGWYVIDDNVLSGADGGSLYLKVKESESEGAQFEAAFVGEDDSGDAVADALTIEVASCSVDSTSGGRSIRQFVSSELVIGGLKTEVSGDSADSEWLKVAGKKIVIQGYPGHGDGAAELDNCGLTFKTVGPRVDENGKKIPAKIIVGVREKDPEESWAARTMNVPLPGGGTKIVHFLGCDDVDLSETGGGGGGGNGDSVIGSDYIKVGGEQDSQDADKTNKAVKAKIDTPNAVPSADEDKHALLTNDTDQNVRSAKTFLGSGQPSSSDRIIIDGPNAKIQAKSADGNKSVDIEAATGKETLTDGSKKIVLDPSAIPDACQKKEISVKTLKVTHRYPKDGKESEAYHILGCDDVEIKEGDIKKLTFKKSGSDDVGFDGTEDKVVEMTVRNLVAGSGISLTTSGNDIMITNTAQGGGGGGGGGSEDGITGDVPFLDGFQYDKVNHKLQYRFGLMTFEKGILVGVKQGQIHGMNFEDVPGGDAVEETV